MTMPKTVTCVLFLIGLLTISWAAPWIEQATISSNVRPNDRIDLRQSLSKATVKYGNRSCTNWTGLRFKCGPKPWHWVGPYAGTSTTSVGRTIKQCIWAHPAPGGPLKITIPGIKGKPYVFGHAALLDTPKDGRTVKFTVKAGKEKQQLILRDSTPGWQAWALSSAEKNAPEVTFSISTPDSNWRHVCFTAYAGEEKP